MAAFFFLIVLPAIYGVGWLIFLFFAGVIVTGCIMRVFKVYYGSKAAYMRTMIELRTGSKDNNLAGPEERLAGKK